MYLVMSIEREISLYEYMIIDVIKKFSPWIMPPIVKLTTDKVIFHINTNLSPDHFNNKERSQLANSIHTLHEIGIIHGFLRTVDTIKDCDKIHIINFSHASFIEDIDNSRLEYYDDIHRLQTMRVRYNIQTLLVNDYYYYTLCTSRAISLI